ncbi:hypothetical protein WICPIJ_001022 [Wickerhamomyces pijperi]|uniref:Uncharacterized protein n=1 Tax=Wickerhamomyces pijperi TaxID=599730 RepID=A0A9P8QED8_WICPI|nr:hypothetical protein WICPIJ_001022 [Wickerhamomyces pijperi]
MSQAPERNGEQRDNSDEPLLLGELVIDGSNSGNLNIFSRAERDQEESPHRNQRDEADRQRNEEPLTPRRLWVHHSDRDDVLWRGNWRRHPTNVGSQSDPQDQLFGESGTSWERSEQRLDDRTTLAMLYLDKAAAKVNPPSNNMITDPHIDPKMNLEADSGSILLPLSSFSTPKVTINKGTNSEVTNNGMASVAHKIDAHTNKAKQFFCSTSWKGETCNNSAVTVIVKIKVNVLPVNKLSELLLSSSSPTITSLEFLFLATVAY